MTLQHTIHVATLFISNHAVTKQAEEQIQHTGVEVTQNSCQNMWRAKMSCFADNEPELRCQVGGLYREKSITLSSHRSHTQPAFTIASEIVYYCLRDFMTQTQCSKSRAKPQENRNLFELYLLYHRLLSRVMHHDKFQFQVFVTVASSC